MNSRCANRMHFSVFRPHFQSMDWCPSAAATSKNQLWLNRPISDSNEVPVTPVGESSDTSQRPNLQTNNNRRESSGDLAAVTSKTADSSTSSGLWMNLSGGSRSDQQQTNNNTSRRRGANSSSSTGQPIVPSMFSDTDDDYEIVSDMSELRSLKNTSAIARGADALVKNSLSRQTEIIDMSKLVEEGKVSTEYAEEPEIVEDQDRKMIDDYEKMFAYARRLRALLNMKFRELDRGTVDTNFLLIKAHEHPTQRMIDRWRNVDYGVSYNDQVKRQKQIEDYRTNAVKKKEKKGEESTPYYPDDIRFTVRIRKENSENRWKDYLAYRQKQKKMSAKKSSGPVPKPNDKYVFAFQDIWSYCIAVYAKPWASVREIVDPVFARIGLDRRADFTFTIGCFNNDKRAGKAKILGVPNLPEPLDVGQVASELYKRNCTEIYVNDDRCDMFRIFPSYYNPKLVVEEKKKKKKKDRGGKAAGKNKSNLEKEVDVAAAPNLSGNNSEAVEDSVLASPVSSTRIAESSKQPRSVVTFEPMPTARRWRPTRTSLRSRLGVLGENSQESVNRFCR